MRCEIQEARSYRVKSTVLGRTRFARFGRGIVVVSVMALAVVASVPACAVDALPQEVNDEEVVVAG
jgi:hypothetical protein